MVDLRKDQSGSRLVLREAQLAREGRLDTRHAPFAEHQLRIAKEHFTQWHIINGVMRPPLFNQFPGLKARNREEFEAAYNQFYRSPAADPYRVRNRKAQLGHL